MRRNCVNSAIYIIFAEVQQSNVFRSGPSEEVSKLIIKNLISSLPFFVPCNCTHLEHGLYVAGISLWFEVIIEFNGYTQLLIGKHS